jgi:hypothetical protein
MPDPDEGTTEFRMGSLRELLDEGEKASAPPPGGPKINKNVLIGGGVAVAILIVVLIVALAGGGGGGGSKEENGRSTFPVEVRSTVLSPDMRANSRVSICGADNTPLAQNVRIVSRTTAKELGGLSTTSLAVSATPDEQARLAAYRSRVKDIAVFPLPACPQAATTTATSPPTTAPPASAPPASSPPASG